MDAFTGIQIPLHGRNQRGTKKPLDEGERGEWKAGLKPNIQKIKIMTTGPITWWQLDGKEVKTMIDFIFLGSKINVDDDCNHEIKTNKQTTFSLEEKLWQT